MVVQSTTQYALGLARSHAHDYAIQFLVETDDHPTRASRINIHRSQLFQYANRRTACHFWSKTLFTPIFIMYSNLQTAGKGEWLAEKGRSDT